MFYASRAKISNSWREEVSSTDIRRFTSIFCLVTDLCVVIAVLSLVAPATESIMSSNETTFLNVTDFLLSTNGSLEEADVENLALCGANFCPVKVATDANPNLKPPPTSQIHLINGIYLACMVAACAIVALGVDSMNR